MNESGDIDALAAEYVLGTLDAGERARAQKLLTADHALAAKVRIWERRLSELHLMVEPIEPEDEIWDRIKRKVPRPAAAPPPPVAAAPVVAPAASSARPDPMPEFKPPPVPEFKPASLPEAKPAPVLPAASTFAPPTWEPAPFTDDTATKERPSLESLEEAVLRAADDLQRRAAAAPPPEPAPEPAVEPVVEVVAEPAAVETAIEAAAVLPADPGPAEADGKPSEETGSVPDEIGKSAEDSQKKPETPPPAAVADEEPAPSVVVDQPPTPPPTPPLAAFPTPFTATAPSSAVTPAVPAPSPTLTVTPPVVPPSPAVAVRPSERRAPPPAAKSPWLARTIATLATLILLMAAALVAAWRFAPERVPVSLQPVELLRAAGIAVPTVVVGPPPRKPAPPESQYDE